MEGERNPETEVYIEKKKRFTMRYMDTCIQYEFLSYGSWCRVIYCTQLQY